ncbi:MAG: cell division protein FtsZ [Muribaculaceae bacterium]|nr:cell division protein FtsZ [Muribaculaceae bacterium]
MDDNINDYDTPGLPLEDSINPPSIIKVIGVGGGGNNAINHMYKQNIENVSFVVCNTDAQALHNSVVPTRVLIGPKTTKGLGAGNDPEKAKMAAEESVEEIQKLFTDQTRMVFITAGMGGGTGTGAAPVVARIAHEMNMLTIGIVTIPFLFEGEKKILKALAGADEMSKYVDALLVINNERLTDIYKDLSFTDAFAKADDTLSTAAHSISELINTDEGYINLDFNDVNTTLKNGGVAIISRGFGEGENRVTKAIEDALNSPLLKNRDVEGSKKLLFNIYISRKAEKPFVMEEANELTDFMAKFAPEVDVIWGVAFDDTLGDQVRITLLASGFEVTLNDDRETTFCVKKRGKAEVVVAPTKDDQERIAEEYGQEKYAKRQQDKARARYIILTPEQFDKDEIVDILEKNPTFNRDVKVRESIKAVTNPQKDSDKDDNDNQGVSPSAIMFN